MNIQEDLPPMTFRSYMWDFAIGIVLWVPYTLMAFILPVVGWILIPTVPFFPFFYPFLKRHLDKKKLIKLRKQALEEAQFKNLNN